MTSNILNEFKQILKQVPWMDLHSRQAALEKADAIKPQIAYPDIIFNNTYLENLYNVITFIMLLLTMLNLIITLNLFIPLIL